MQNTLLYFGIVIIAIILTLILHTTRLESKNKLILVVITYFIYLLLFYDKYVDNEILNK